MNFNKILIPATMITFIFASTAFAAPVNPSNDQKNKPAQSHVMNNKFAAVHNQNNHQEQKPGQHAQESQASKLNKLVRQKIITENQKNKIQYALTSRNNHGKDLKSILNSLVRSKVINKYQSDKVYKVLISENS